MALEDHDYHRFFVNSLKNTLKNLPVGSGALVVPGVGGVGGPCIVIGRGGASVVTGWQGS